METQIISYNVKGLQSSEAKRAKIFHYLKMKGVSIAMLQETHSKLENERSWTKEWGGVIVFSHGSSSSRGTCIMFAPNMNFEIHDKYTDQHGRLVVVNVTINHVKPW